MSASIHSTLVLLEGEETIAIEFGIFAAAARVKEWTMTGREGTM